MSVRKMVMVPIHVLEEMNKWKMEQVQKPRLPPNPQITMTSDLQKEMQTTMNRDDLTESEKAQRYGENLYKFQLAHKKALTEPVKPLISPVSNSDSSSVSPMPKKKINDRIIESVPPAMRRRAKLLLDMLQDHPNLSWDEHGTVIMNEKPLEGTNIIDLVNDTIRQRKQFEPKGWQTFSKALKDVNVPQDIVGNKKRWNWMNQPETDDEDSFEDSFETPSSSKFSKTIKKKSPMTPKRSLSAMITPRGIKREFKTPKMSKWDPY